MKLLSVVVPCYNEEAALPYFYEAITKVARDFAGRDVEFEFRFVNDGSKDGTLKVLKALREKDQRVHFPEISGKKPPSMRDLPRQRVIISL